MTEVKWHPIRAVETEDRTIKWEGNTPTPYVNVLVTTADGYIVIDAFIQACDGCYFITLVDDAIAWAEMPEPFVREEEEK